MNLNKFFRTKHNNKKEIESIKYCAINSFTPII